ncbi:MAG: hypothetical protein KF709_02455 [Gemmatimonadaceae bacterium]|nr:hypothetical protein [Gemmatimonadaceae bacterium]
MSLDSLLSEQELREKLKLAGASKRAAWYRVRPFFASAVVTVPNGTVRGHRLYDATRVEELLEARSNRNSPLSRVRALKKVG